MTYRGSLMDLDLDLDLVLVLALVWVLAWVLALVLALDLALDLDLASANHVPIFPGSLYWGASAPYMDRY